MKHSDKKSGPKSSTSVPASDFRMTVTRRPLKISLSDDGDDAGFECHFMEEIIAQDPCNEDALILLAYAYTHRGEYDKGLLIDKRLVRLRPHDPTAYYNLACSYALLTHTEDAFIALEKAVSLGYRDVSHLMRDPDLDNLRREPQFKRFLNRVFKRSPKDS